MQFTKLAGLFAVAAGGWFLQQLVELGLEVFEFDPILRALRAGHARRHVGEIEVEIDAVINLAFLGDAPHVLGFEIIAERDYFRVGAAGGAEVIERLVINGEETHRRAILGRHVGDGGTVGDGQALRASAVELHKLADHLRFAQQLRDMQREVGRGHAGPQHAGHVHADDFGCEEIDRLPEHAGFGFDAADAPADNAEAVDHGGVRVGADQRVGIINIAGMQHAFGEIFEIHLVDDADAGRNDLEGLERLLAPLQQLVAFPVALELKINVLLKRGRGAEEIHLHRVIHHKVNRHERLDDGWVFAEALDSGTHRRQIHQQRHAGKVLQHDARDDEWDLLLGRRLGVPVGQRAHVALGDFLAVHVAQHGFEHDADADWQARNLADARRFERR